MSLIDGAIPPKVLSQITFNSNASVVDDTYGGGVFAIALDMTGEEYWFQSILRQNTGGLQWWIAVFPYYQGGNPLQQTLIQLTTSYVNLLKPGTTIFLAFDTSKQEFEVVIESLGIDKKFSVAGTPFAQYVMLPNVVDLTVGGLMQGSSATFSDMSLSGNIYLGTSMSATGKVYTEAPPFFLDFADNVSWQAIGEGNNITPTLEPLGAGNVPFVGGA